MLGIVLIFLLPIMLLAGIVHSHVPSEQQVKDTTTKLDQRASFSQGQKNKKIGSEHQEEESMVTLSHISQRDNHIEIKYVRSEIISQSISVFGKIVPIRSKEVLIHPRFAGIVKSLPYQLGDKVNKGAVLATIESNESLQNYTIKAPFSGILVKQNVNEGKFVKPEISLYELTDLSSVWVELSIYRRDAGRVSKGNTVYVVADGNNIQPVKTNVDYISPIGNEHTQSLIARAVLSNEDYQWTPGLYVDANIVVKEKTAPVAVEVGAIQTVDEKKVVFVQVKKGTFEPKVVQLGLRGTRFVQVLTGLNVGMRYVSSNSFILKAELKKSSAEHSH
jgi:cobalt-zinc-cadmium efflux system membrane fusion protein